MMHLVVYDLSDTPCRIKTAEYLEGRGRRIQESVFECDLAAAEVSRMAEELATIAAGHGTISIYPVCAECYSKTIGIGNIRNDPGEKGFVVF